MNRLRPRLPAVALVGVILAAGGLAMLAALQADPLRQAWSAVQRQSDYTFQGTTRAQIGSVSTSHTVRGEGHPDGRLRVQVVDEPTDLITGEVSTTYDLAWPTVAETDATSQSRQDADEYALATILPTGDPLAYLAVAHAPRVGEVESVGDRSCRRVEFLVSGLAYGAWWQRHQGYVPAGAASGPLEKLSGEGAVWINEGRNERAHLPCRITLRLALVRLAGEQAGVGEADWEYGEWR